WVNVAKTPFVALPSALEATPAPQAESKPDAKPEPPVFTTEEESKKLGAQYEPWVYELPAYSARKLRYSKTELVEPRPPPPPPSAGAQPGMPPGMPQGMPQGVPPGVPPGMPEEGRPDAAFGARALRAPSAQRPRPKVSRRTPRGLRISY